MTEVNIGKYCQFIIIFTKYWGNIIIYLPPRISGDRLHPPNFPVMPAGLPVEGAKVPSRYYRVPRYFFTVLTVAHNRWYRPTLHAKARMAKNCKTKSGLGSQGGRHLGDLGSAVSFSADTGSACSHSLKDNLCSRPT